jgi:1-pyrroline-5-carboxylate dehydrogenase
MPPCSILPKSYTRTEALTQVKAGLGKDYGMLIGGKERYTVEKIEDRSPANTDVVLGIFQKGGEQDALDALASASQAFPIWSQKKWQERVTVMRKAAELITERIFTISAALSMEVGKNRMESLGDVQETADLIYYYCDEVERNNGYVGSRWGATRWWATAPQIIPTCSPMECGW